jgi:hypothetical protein
LGNFEVITGSFLFGSQKKLKDSNKEAKEYAGRRLIELTGKSFEQPDEWRRWYQRHAGELVWSDEKHQFILRHLNLQLNSGAMH